MAEASESTLHGPGDSNLERLGGDVKRLFNAVNNLTHHGIDAIADVSIPKIALVGDQSAGKSSLVEALSQIQVPRDAGTCTRCPMEITVEGVDGEWSAHISLLKTHCYDPGSEQTEDETFWPWIQLSETVRPSEFKLVERKEELENALRQAQAAILTPGHTATNSSADGGAAAHQQVAFSPNIVVVKIRGKGLPNLSFIDLPGVISQSDDGDSRTVTLVKNLARTYIRQPNTLILLACSMENDIMNSSASALVNEENANMRCMGVLTKPDRMARGKEATIQWKELLDGVKFKRGLGYFVTKQPDQKQLSSITHEMARAAEYEYFTSAKWEKNFPGYSSQLGTNALARALSAHLVALIEAQLPQICARVEEKLDDIQGQLDGMPEPPQDALHEVIRIVREFSNMIKAKVSNVPTENAARKVCVAALTTFSQTIIDDLRPVFLLYADLTEPKSNSTTQQETSETSTPKRARVEGQVKVEAETQTPSPRSARQIRTVRARTNASPQKASVAPKAISFTCAQLKEAIDIYEVPGLRGEVNVEGLNILILRTVRAWEQPVSKIFEVVADGLRETLDQAVSHVDVCGGYQGSLLLSEMQNFTSNFVSALIVTEKEKAVEAARREGFRVVVYNAGYFDSEKEDEVHMLRTRRLARRAKTLASSHGDKLDISSGDRDAQKKIEAFLAKKPYALEPDPYDREVEVMAKIKAYYRIAATRLVENVCMMIEAGVLHRLMDLPQELEMSLAIYGGQGPQHWAGMLLPDPRVGEKRIQLAAQAHALQAAFDELRQLSGDNAADMMDLEEGV